MIYVQNFMLMHLNNELSKNIKIGHKSHEVPIKLQLYNEHITLYFMQTFIY